MAREDFCKRCSRYAGCGFISRNLQTKCDILQIFEESYEQGYEDVEVKYFIEDFRKAMKGE